MTSLWFVGWMAATVVLVRPWRVAARPLAPTASNGSASARPRAAVTSRDLGLLILGALLVVEPVLALFGVVAIPVRRRWRRRVAAGADQRAHLRRLPEAIDLVALGVGAGQTPRRAFETAAPFLPAPFADLARQVRRRTDAGDGFAAAVEVASVDLDPACRPLVALLMGATKGGAVLPALARLGDEARRQRRAVAQERARRLPVTLLLPLVVCVLPAFALLAVVPLLLGSLDAIDL